MSYYAFEGLIGGASGRVCPSQRRADWRCHRGRRCLYWPTRVIAWGLWSPDHEAGSNLQDGCIMHGYCDTDTIVHENGHIGHGAILHGCVVGRDARSA